MKNIYKTYITIGVIFIIFSAYFILTDYGGSGFGNIIDLIFYCGTATFIVSIYFFIKSILEKKFNWIFFIISLITFFFAFQFFGSKIYDLYLNRNPNLNAKYKRPVDKKSFIKDSLNIQKAITELAKIKNKKSGGTDILYAKIDTIIYSENAKKIFIIYFNKFDKNFFGNDIDLYYLSADKKTNGFWQLEEGPPNSPNYSGSFHSEIEAKKYSRKMYFNRYRFGLKDSLKENYFWK